MTREEAFFTLHEGLPREGPGEPADIVWAAAVAGVPPDARICDAGCGPGADLPALVAAAPEGHVIAVDRHADFVEAAAALNLPQVDARQGDMADLTGPHDLIWAAGSLYFLGITEGLRAWRRTLAPGGAVAFSEACWFTEAPSDRSRRAWAGYPAMTDAAGIDAAVAAAGYRTLGTRRLGAAAWEAYYGPMQARIAALRPGAGATLTAVLDEAEAEIAAWRAGRDEFGYLLSVVRPA